MNKKGIQLIPCPKCKGSGEDKGVFHLLTCMDCNGLGEVRSDTGEALEDQQIITRLMERNRQLLRRAQELTNINRKPEPTTQDLQRKWRGVAG